MKKLVILCLALIFAMPSYATVRSEPIPYSYWTDYALSDKCPADKPFLSEEVVTNSNPRRILNYKCVSCFEFDEDFVRIPEGHEKDFEICDNRDIVDSYGTLYSVNKCPSDFPLRVAWDAFREAWYGCESCHAVQWLKIKEADCRLCGDWRTMQELDGARYCVLNKSLDPDRPLVENDDKLSYGHNTHLVSCAETKDIHTTKENCDLCPNRQYIDGECILKECPANRPLRMKDGSCSTCDTESVAPKLDDASICPNRINVGEFNCPKDMPLHDEWKCHPCQHHGFRANEWERIDYSKEACEQCPDERVFENGLCLFKSGEGSLYTQLPIADATVSYFGKVSCFDEVGLALTSKSNCDECPNRVYEDGYCYTDKWWFLSWKRLKKAVKMLTCPADKPLRGQYDGCVPCDTKEWIITEKEDDCQVCGDMRTIVLGYCVLNKSPDRTHPIVDNYSPGNKTVFLSCDERRNIQTAKENCDLCPNWEYSDGRCVFKYCPVGYFDKAWPGLCIKCDNRSTYPATAEECAKCPNREYVDGECVLKESK